MRRKYTYRDDFKLYKRLLSYIVKYWPAFVIAMLGNLIYSGIDSGMTYMLKPILNKGFIARDLHFVAFLPFLVLGAFLVRGIANLISSYFISYVSTGVVMDFRQMLFRHFMKLPAVFFDNSSTGNILSIVIYNVAQVANAGSDIFTKFTQSLFLLIGLLVVMFTISWRMSLIFLVTVPFIALTVHMASRRLRKISLSVQREMGQVTSIAEEAIDGYRVVKGFGGQEYETAKFDKATSRNRLKNLKVTITNSLAVSSVQFVAAIVLAFIIYLAISPHSAAVLSPGSFVAMIAAMMALLKPLKNVTSISNRIQRALAGAESIFEVLDLEPEHDEGTIALKHAKGHIVYDHVDFTYSSTRRQVLFNVNFEVKPGQVIALVGRSGSGKSTIINLLQRFYMGWKGNIKIDDVPIRNYILSDLRQQFSAVSQHVVLFNDTVSHNIAYGKFSQASEEEIIKAAKAANAWEFIKDLPEGLNTIIGEDGVLLSGGQRQRIAIARAILKNAPILILDEATSSLDTESERQIQTALERLMENRTTLVIAHRLSTIEHADLIVVLDQGKVIEIGRHEELLSRDGHYAYFYKMQFKDI